MRISVPAETAVHERRVALVPDGVARLVKSGHHVTVQRGAGARAFLADQLYEEAGATLAADAAATFAAGELVLKVQPPSLDEVALLARGATLASLMQPSANAAIIERLVADGVNGLALELVPRITRASSAASSSDGGCTLSTSSPAANVAAASAASVAPASS